MTIIQTLIEKTYYILWGDWIHFSLPGGIQLQIPLLALLLFPTGIWFTLRTRFLQLRLLPDMLRSFTEKKQDPANGRSLSSLQALIVSTATRVGMGNLVGCGSCNLCRRCRRFILDVDYGTVRRCHGFYRSYSCPAPQAEGSSLRWLPGRSRLLYP